MPRRIVIILEGESLVNDATALVLYRSAVAAAVSGSFVLGDTLLQFLYAAAAGIAVGLLVGLITRWALQVIGESFAEIAATLLAPYVAWVLSESIHASAVLSCVAGGLYLRQHVSRILAPATRIQGRAVWNLLIFLLNGVIFILIGLQLAALRAAVPTDRLGSLMLGGVLISVTAILVGMGAVGRDDSSLAERVASRARSDAAVAGALFGVMDRDARHRHARRRDGLADVDRLRGAVSFSS
jgi:CPA1 family monovalent cation:H+ antiporter